MYLFRRCFEMFLYRAPAIFKRFWSNWVYGWILLKSESVYTFRTDREPQMRLWLWHLLLYFVVNVGYRHKKVLWRWKSGIRLLLFRPIVKRATFAGVKFYSKQEYDECKKIDSSIALAGRKFMLIGPKCKQYVASG